MYIYTAEELQEVKLDLIENLAEEQALLLTLPDLGIISEGHDDFPRMSQCIDLFINQYPSYKREDLFIKSYYWNKDSFMYPLYYLYSVETQLPLVCVFHPNDF